MRQEREKATDANVKAGSAASREINQLREELTKANATVGELNDKVDKVLKLLYYFHNYHTLFLCLIM